MLRPGDRQHLRARLKASGLDGAVLETALEMAELVGIEGLPRELERAEMELVDEVLREWETD